MLQKAVVETKAEFDKLNARSFEYQSIKREAEGDKKLYEDLVRKIKEAGINAGFQNSSIRVADAARPGLKQVFPDIKLNVALAFLFSSLLAFGAAVISDAMDNTIRDPEQVSVPADASSASTISKNAARPACHGVLERSSSGGVLLRAGRETRASAPHEEAIRTLRTRSLTTSIASSARCW